MKNKAVGERLRLSFNTYTDCPAVDESNYFHFNYYYYLLHSNSCILFPINATCTRSQIFECEPGYEKTGVSCVWKSDSRANAADASIGTKSPAVLSALCLVSFLVYRKRASQIQPDESENSNVETQAQAAAPQPVKIDESEGVSNKKLASVSIVPVPSAPSELGNLPSLKALSVDLNIPSLAVKKSLSTEIVLQMRFAELQEQIKNEFLKLKKFKQTLGLQ